MQITVDWSSTFKPDKLDADMLQRGQTAMVKVVTEIRNRAKQKLQWRKAPGAGLGGRATGTLARGIIPSVRVSHTEIEGTVKVSVPYGRYVEGWNSLGQHTPTVKHWLSFFDKDGTPRWGIINWALRHGVAKYVSRKAQRFAKRFSKALPFALSRTAMMVGGPGATTPFLEPTFLEVLPSAREILAGSITSG